MPRVADPATPQRYFPDAGSARTHGSAPAPKLSRL